MMSEGLNVGGLFAGIGGIELGLHEAGHQTRFLCEWDESARTVLRHRFPDSELVGDVSELDRLPPLDLLTAGFPCQDLSQAGRTAGISGTRSGLVQHVFRLLDSSPAPPTWLLLENVSFMLSLDGGRAMEWLTGELERRGWAWAYRVVDSRAFGVPQRRQRVLMLASPTEDPRPALFNEDAGEPETPTALEGVACGFYWTEGLRGLGWAVDSVPTLKGGSGLGIPSPPAIWEPGTGRIVTPSIEDAERLQGFPAGWTAAVEQSRGRGASNRWKLVGNAVTVGAASWLGGRLMTHETYAPPASDIHLDRGTRWPRAAWGTPNERRAVPLSMWPVRTSRPPLKEFLEHPTKPLSARASRGFLERARRSSLRFPPGLLTEVENHLNAVEDGSQALTTV